MDGEIMDIFLGFLDIYRLAVWRVLRERLDWETPASLCLDDQAPSGLGGCICLTGGSSGGDLEDHHIGGAGVSVSASADARADITRGECKGAGRGECKGECKCAGRSQRGQEPEDEGWQGHVIF